MLTTPLIEGTDGRKMSKSYKNYIALEDEAVEVYGKIMSISDELIIKYFEVLTRVDMAKIEEMKKALDQGENPMQFKKQLAWQITSDLHGEPSAKKASKYFAQSIQNDAIPDRELFTDLIVEVEAKAGQPRSSNNIFSNSQLARLFEQGAVKLLPEQKLISNWQEFLSLPDGSQLKIGKHRFYQLKIKK